MGHGWRIHLKLQPTSLLLPGQWAADELCAAGLPRGRSGPRLVSNLRGNVRASRNVKGEEKACNGPHPWSMTAILSPGRCRVAHWRRPLRAHLHHRSSSHNLAVFIHANTATDNGYSQRWLKNFVKLFSEKQRSFAQTLSMSSMTPTIGWRKLTKLSKPPQPRCSSIVILIRKFKEPRPELTCPASTLLIRLPLHKRKRYADSSAPPR